MAVAARTGTGFRTGPLALLGDERLARLAAAGHERAFGVVYERHQQTLYRYCRSILRNDADAQDALQSTFTAALAALGRGRPDAPIRPWLFRIAHNEAVSLLRRRRPTAELSEATDYYGTTSVEEQATERAELDLLLRDLRELHERQRSALVMRELSGLSHDEIAAALQTSVATAKQAIYEARRSLFEFAEGRATPCDEIQRTISDADGRLLRSRRVRAHLRDCTACAAFAAAIPERRQELRALVPTLPTVAAAGLLQRIVGAGAGAGSGAGHGAGTGLGGLLTGAAGKAAGSALAANALAGVAVVASATVGVTIGVDRLAHPGAHARDRSSATRTAAHAPRSVRAPSPAALRPVRAGVPAVTGRTAAGASALHLPAPIRGARHTARGARHTASGARHTASGARQAASFTRSTEAGPGPGNHPGATGAPTRHGPPPWAGTGNGRKSRPASPAGSAAPGSAAPARTPSGHGPPAWAGASRNPGASVEPGVSAMPAVAAPPAVPSPAPSSPPGAAVSAAHKHGD